MLGHLGRNDSLGRNLNLGESTFVGLPFKRVSRIQNHGLGSQCATRDARRIAPQGSGPGVTFPNFFQLKSCSLGHHCNQSQIPVNMFRNRPSHSEQPITNILHDDFPHLPRWGFLDFHLALLLLFLLFLLLLLLLLRQRLLASSSSPASPPGSSLPASSNYLAT